MNDPIKESLKTHLEMWQASGVQEIVMAKTEKKKTTPSPNPSHKGRGIAPGSLSDISDEIGDCKRCKLHKGRTNIVFGVGNPKAELMFVGEAPGADEDLTGEPFVGRAGQLLTKMIEAMGLKRSDIYIANIVKCRPPENRNPEPDEISNCEPFLKKQIDAIKPKVIVALGKFAAQTLLQTEIPISKLRGQFDTYNGAKLMPTYHPAFLLRNPPMKKFVWEDLQKVMNVLGLKSPTQSPATKNP